MAAPRRSISSLNAKDARTAPGSGVWGENVPKFWEFSIVNAAIWCVIGMKVVVLVE